MTLLPLLFAATLASQPLKVSIFSCHIETISQQEKIPFAEAAQRVRDLGYDGIDIEEGFPSEHLAVAKSLGFVFPCVIGHLAFEREYDAEHCARLHALALSNGCRRVMLVPGFYPKNADRAEVFKTIVDRTGPTASPQKRRLTDWKHLSRISTTNARRHADAPRCQPFSPRRPASVSFMTPATSTVLASGRGADWNGCRASVIFT